MTSPHLLTMWPGQFTTVWVLSPGSSSPNRRWSTAEKTTCSSQLTDTVSWAAAAPTSLDGRGTWWRTHTHISVIHHHHHLLLCFWTFSDSLLSGGQREGPSCWVGGWRPQEDEAAWHSRSQVGGWKLLKKKPLLMSLVMSLLMSLLMSLVMSLVCLSSQTRIHLINGKYLTFNFKILSLQLILVETPAVETQ